MIVSVIPYRSSTTCPLPARTASCSCAGSGAEPLTARRSPASVGQVRRVGQPVVHGRHPEEQARAALVTAAATAAGLERGAAAIAAAPGDQRAVQADPEPVHVEQRQAQRQRVVGLPAPGQPDRVGAGQQVGVGQRYALGLPGGARGVDDQRGVVPGPAWSRSAQPPPRAGSGGPGPGVVTATGSPASPRPGSSSTASAGPASATSARQLRPGVARCWPAPRSARPAARRRRPPPARRWYRAEISIRSPGRRPAAA